MAASPFNREDWTEAKEAFWREVAEKLPPRKRRLASVLRDRIEDWRGDRKKYDPELIYHRQPAEVAAILDREPPGYQELAVVPNREEGDVFQWLAEQDRSLFVNPDANFLDPDDQDMEN